MIEKIPYTKPVGSERDMEVFFRAGEMALLIDKLNELIDAYNALSAKYEEHYHEYREATMLGTNRPTVTSKPLQPKSTKQENEK